VRIIQRCMRSRATEIREETQELGTGHPVFEIEFAWQVAKTAMYLDRFGMRIQTEDLGTTAGWMQESQQRAQRGRFSCPVWTEESEDLPVFDTEGDIVDPAIGPIGFGQAVGSDGGGCWQENIP